VSATLRVTREVGFGIELRRGRFELSRLTAKASGRSHTMRPSRRRLNLRHTVRVRADRYSSRDQAFDVADGEVANFRCHRTRIWPLYVASVFAPSLAISLKRE